MNFSEEIIVFFTDISKKYDINIYLVGGAVRDKILGGKPYDYDFVAELDKKSHYEVSTNISKILGEKFDYNNYYGTAKFTYKGITIDFVMARKEYYPYPAAKPVICPANIIEDLKRRDFTINSIAYDLKNKKIIDIYNGIEDIKNKKIKILHNLSFRDDPTRILRGIKYGARFGFIFDEETLKFMLDALDNKYLNLLSKTRLRNEFLNVFMENIKSVADFLINIDVLSSIVGTKVNINKHFDEKYFDILKDEEKFIVLLYKNDDEVLKKLAEDLNLSKRFLMISKVLKEIKINLDKRDFYSLFKVLILNESRVDKNLILCLFSNDIILNYFKVKGNINFDKRKLANLTKEEIINYKITTILQSGGDKDV